MTLKKYLELNKELYVLGILEGVLAIALFAFIPFMTYMAVSGVYENALAATTIFGGLELMGIISIAFGFVVCEDEKKRINKLLSDD